VVFSGTLASATRHRAESTLQGPEPQRVRTCQACGHVAARGVVLNFSTSPHLYFPRRPRGPPDVARAYESVHPLGQVPRLGTSCATYIRALAEHMVSTRELASTDTARLTCCRSTQRRLGPGANRFANQYGRFN